MTQARPRRSRCALVTSADPVLLSLVYALAALLLPLEVVEVLGAPRGGRRLLPGAARRRRAALWTTLIATIAFLSIHQGDLEDYIVTVVGYLVIGVLVGLAVDRFARQKRELEDAVEVAGLARKQLAASEGRYRLLFEQSATPCICTVSTPPASPPASWPSTTRPVRCWATRVRSSAV